MTAEAPGTFVDVAAGFHVAVGVSVGNALYLAVLPGCAGNLPTSQLVALDALRIGTTLRVSIDNLPISAAIMVTGGAATIRGAFPRICDSTHALVGR